VDCNTLEVDAAGPHPEFSLAHEFGHLLAPAADAASAAVAELRSIQAATTEQAVADYVRYSLDSDEMWARAYAQYVATRSSDALLAAQLATILADANPIYRATQWHPADFAPLAVAIDAWMETLGWRTP
jgi:hypothetical protein